MLARQDGVQNRVTCVARACGALAPQDVFGGHDLAGWLEAAVEAVDGVGLVDDGGVCHAMAERLEHGSATS
jgi:hypothetical protein